MNTQKRKLIAAVSLCAAVVIPNLVSATSITSQGDWTTTLQARYLGSSTTINAYYDTSLGITWLADANAAGTVMDWATANTWAANLNVNGVTGWSLPTVTDTGTPGCNLAYTGTDCGYNVNTATDPLAHMFYTTLGDKAQYNTSGVPQAGYGLTNTGPFSNLQSGYYWTGTGYATSAGNAWYFGTINGNQNFNSQTLTLSAWAVHAGDVGAASPVPVPAAVWLFSSGLLGLIGITRQKTT